VFSPALAGVVTSCDAPMMVRRESVSPPEVDPVECNGRVHIEGLQGTSGLLGREVDDGDVCVARLARLPGNRPRAARQRPAGRPSSGRSDPPWRSERMRLPSADHSSVQRLSTARIRSASATRAARSTSVMCTAGSYRDSHLFWRRIRSAGVASAVISSLPHPSSFSSWKIALQ